jgi:hypothetical protein
MNETDIVRLLDRAGQSYRPDAAQGLAAVRARTARPRRSRRTGRVRIGILAVAVSVAIGLVVIAQSGIPSPVRYLRIPPMARVVRLSTPTNGLADVSFADALHGIGMKQDCFLSETVDTTCSLVIVRTGDGGRTWTRVGHALHVTYPDSRDSYPFINFVTNGRDGWIYGSKNFVTHDGGRTFAADGPGGLVTDLSIVGNAAWAVSRPCPPAVAGCASIVYSVPTTGGQWEVVRGAPRLTYPYLQLLRPSTNEAILAAQATDKTLYITGDDGRTWVGRPMPGLCSQLLHLTAVAGRDVWALCSGGAPSDVQTKNLYRSVDTGRTWALVASSGPGATSGTGTLPTLGIVTLITSVSPDRLWIALDDDRLLASMDGGRTWTGQGLPPSRAVNQLTFTNARDGWALLSPGDVLYRTSDGGRRWLPAPG